MLQNEETQPGCQRSVPSLAVIILNLFFRFLGVQEDDFPTILSGKQSHSLTGLLRKTLCGNIDADHIQMFVIFQQGCHRDTCIRGVVFVTTV